MKLAVFSHKPCWRSKGSASGFATDGGFPFHMAALSELFDGTVLVVPCGEGDAASEAPLRGHNLRVAPLSPPWGHGLLRKILFPLWVLRNAVPILKGLLKADAVHAPIPGDIGTIGMVGAVLLRKPLFVRHCGNWLRPRTKAEHFWRWFMERFAGGRNVMLATGGSAHRPSEKNPAVRWIFSSSLTRAQLAEYGHNRYAPLHRQARLCLVARQDPQKGAGVVIRALPFIAKKFPAALFDVVGEGPGIAEFERIAKEFDVSDKVIFHGKLGHKAVMDVLQKADIFCFPTEANDGFPKAVLEGLASGLPVVATRVSVLPQLLQRGGGVLIEERTPEAVAAAVEEILSGQDRYETMSKRAIETAREFSLESWRDTIGEQLSEAWGPLQEVENRKQKAETTNGHQLTGINVDFTEGNEENEENLKRLLRKPSRAGGR